MRGSAYSAGIDFSRQNLTSTGKTEDAQHKYGFQNVFFRLIFSSKLLQHDRIGGGGGG